MTAVRESHFVHQGVNVAVIETIAPNSLAHVIHSDPEAADFAKDMARDILEFGEGSFSANAHVLSPKDYRLEVNIDLSKNTRLRRDLNMLAVFSRIGAFFGAGVPPAGEAAAPAAGGAGGTPEGDGRPRYDMPPASLLGDLFRAIGHAIGLGCDYIMLGIWWCVRAVQAGWAKLKDALS